jgi:hypothetical protein
MRDDMDKALREHPRRLSYKGFKDERRTKKFQGDEVGGRESMKKRYDSWGDRKESYHDTHLLVAWLRSCVGKNWDKCYSEFCQKFPISKGKNHEVHSSLWWQIEQNAYVNATGKIVTQCTNRYSCRGEIPIDSCYSDFYICPKTKTLKAVKFTSHRVRARERQAKQEAELAKVKRVIDEYQELHFENGVWFLYTLKDYPAKVLEYRMPKSWFTVQHHTTWAKLTKEERIEQGVATWVQPSVHEVPPQANSSCNYYGRQVGSKYYASRETANNKLLKEHGLDGTATPSEKQLSHREAARYKA